MINVKQKLSEKDREMLELLARTHESKGKQLTIDIQTGDLKEIDEIKQLIGRSFENPEEKYNIYHMGIYKLLRTYLPKGKASEPGRRIIYDEIGVFLNRGKKKSDNKKGIRGSDGKFTYQPLMEQILDIIFKWVSESQDPIKLHSMVWELNETNGYGHENYDESSKSFNAAKRKALLN